MCLRNELKFFLEQLIKLNKANQELQIKVEKNTKKIESIELKSVETKCDILAKYQKKTNVKIDQLLRLGFRIVYNQSYTEYATTTNELYDLRKIECRKESIICVGGSDGNNNLLLVSCGDCQDILSLNTPINEPILINGAFWYLTPNKSFGFSPSQQIKQKAPSDMFDCIECPNRKKIPCVFSECPDMLRLSWEIDGNYAGWRLGNKKLCFIL